MFRGLHKLIHIKLNHKTHSNMQIGYQRSSENKSTHVGTSEGFLWKLVLGCLGQALGAGEKVLTQGHFELESQRANEFQMAIFFLINKNYLPNIAKQQGTLNFTQYTTLDMH